MIDWCWRRSGYLNVVLDWVREWDCCCHRGDGVVDLIFPFAVILAVGLFGSVER